MSCSGPDTNNRTMVPSRESRRGESRPSNSLLTPGPSASAYPPAFSLSQHDLSYMNTQHPNWPRSHLLSSPMPDSNSHHLFPEAHNSFGPSTSFPGPQHQLYLDPNGDSARPRSYSWFDVQPSMATMSGPPSQYYLDQKPMYADQVGEEYTQPTVELGTDYSYDQLSYDQVVYDMSRAQNYQNAFPYVHDIATNSKFCRDIELRKRSSEEPKRDTTRQDDKDEPYAKLIFKALMEQKDKQMVLRDIYTWFEKNTNKAADADVKGWQNSIRHNLSMNGAFQKVDNPDTGESSKKGFLWRLTPEAIAEKGVKSTTRYRSKQPSKRKGAGAPQRLASGLRSPYEPRRSSKRVRSQSLPFSSSNIPSSPADINMCPNSDQTFAMPQIRNELRPYYQICGGNALSQQEFDFQKGQPNSYAFLQFPQVPSTSTENFTPALFPSSAPALDGSYAAAPATPSSMDRPEHSCPNTPDLMMYPGAQMPTHHFIRHPQHHHLFAGSESGDEGPPTPEEMQNLMQWNGIIPHDTDEKYFDCEPTSTG